MNIPLNIDFQQILLHLFNFTILAAGLYVLLYKPVKNFMDKRAQYYKQLDQETKEKLDQAEKLKDSYQAQLSNAEAEISKKKAKAAQEADQAADLQIKTAKKQAEKMLIAAQESAKQEREKILSSAQQEIAELAAIAAEKLVTQSLDNTFDQFLSAAEGGGVHEKRRS